MKSIAQVSLMLLRKYANDEDFPESEDFGPTSDYEEDFPKSEPVPETVKEPNLEVLRPKIVQASESVKQAIRHLASLGKTVNGRFDPENCPLKDKTGDCYFPTAVLGVGSYEWNCPFCDKLHSA